MRDRLFAHARRCRHRAKTANRRRFVRALRPGSSTSPAGSRQLTPWRNGLDNVPSSFSPDGSTPGRSDAIGGTGPEAWRCDLNGGSRPVLARNAEQPVYSPGRLPGRLRQLPPTDDEAMRGHEAPARSSELYAMSADGTAVAAPHTTPEGRRVSPSWDPSGQRLAVHPQPQTAAAALPASATRSWRSTPTAAAATRFSRRTAGRPLRRQLAARPRPRGRPDRLLSAARRASAAR